MKKEMIMLYIMMILTFLSIFIILYKGYKNEEQTNENKVKYGLQNS